MAITILACLPLFTTMVDKGYHASPTTFEAWAAKMKNRTDSTIKAVMFDNAKEFVAGRMKEFCDQKGIHINSSVPYSPSSIGVAE